MALALISHLRRPISYTSTSYIVILAALCYLFTFCSVYYSITKVAAEQFYTAPTRFSAVRSGYEEEVRRHALAMPFPKEHPQDTRLVLGIRTPQATDSTCNQLPSGVLKINTLGDPDANQASTRF
jgi:hypothetical protein